MASIFHNFPLLEGKRKEKKGTKGPGVPDHYHATFTTTALKMYSNYYKHYQNL